jgi:hypothetical protein
VWLAPRDQQAELERIGRDYAGQGPALMTDYAVYGGRHFLRDLGAEAASELRVHPIPLRDGSTLDKAQPADIDDFPSSTLADYPLLVLRRSPIASRPPADYRLEWAGRHYEVWRRDPGRGTVTDGIPLQAGAQPGALADCAQVLDLAARSDGVLVAAERLPVLELPLGPASDSGTVTVPVSVPVAGAYDLWIAGSFPGRLEVGVDGERVYDGRHVIEGDPAAVTQLATVSLAAGDHAVQLTQSTPWLQPGSGAGPFALGPLYLSRQDAGDAELVTVTDENAADLCSRTLDWVQAVTR